MRERYGFLTVFWTVLICFILCVSQPANAQMTQTPGGAAANNFPPPGTPATALPVETPLCPGAANGTNTVDAAARNNMAAQGQALYNQVLNMSTFFPVQNATNACLNNLIQVFQTLANLNTSGVGNIGQIITKIATAAAVGLLTQIVTSVCSQIMSEITSFQNDVTNLAKICLPSFNFGGFTLPKFTIAGCTGGTVVSLNPWQGISNPNVTNYNQYLK